METERQDVWRIVKLGDVTETSRSRVDPQELPDLPYIGMKHVEKNSMELEGIAKGEDYKSSCLRFNPGEILYGKLRPYLNKVYLPDFEGLCSAEFITLKTTKELEAEYLQYILNNKEFVAFADQQATGDRPRVKYDQISEYEFILPPKGIQRRTIDKLEEHLTIVENGEKGMEDCKNKIERYRSSVLQSAFSGNLTGEWRDKQSKKTVYQDEELTDLINSDNKETPTVTERGPIPDSWAWATIGDIFDVSIGSTPSRSNPEYWGGDISWVSSGEVAFCRISETEENITKKGLENSSTTVHPPQTVLLGIIGQGKTRGQAAILDVPAAHNQNTAAIHTSDSPIPAEFIYYFFMENYGRTRMLGSGNQQKALNKDRVQKMQFPLPPMAEQEEIVKRLDQKFSIIDEVEQMIEENINRAQRMRESILQNAMEGKLLERIKPPEDLISEDQELEQQELATFSKEA